MPLEHKNNVRVLVFKTERLVRKLLVLNIPVLVLSGSVSQSGVRGPLLVHCRDYLESFHFKKLIIEKRKLIIFKEKLFMLFCFSVKSLDMKLLCIFWKI